MFVTHKIALGTEHVGATGRITNKAFVDWLCDAANVHSALVGQDWYDTENCKIGWLLMGWVCEIYDRPVPHGEVTVRTWMQNSTRAMSDRDFEVYGPDGKLLGRATSRWMAIDIKRGMLMRLTDEVVAPYQAETETISLPGATFIDANRFNLTPVSTKEFNVLRSMIDGNGHVHNTCYLDIAMEALPQELAYAPFRHFEVCYKKEIKPGAKVILEYCVDGDKHYVVMRSPEDNKIHAIVEFE